MKLLTNSVSKFSSKKMYLLDMLCYWKPRRCFDDEPPLFISFQLNFSKDDDSVKLLRSTDVVTLDECMEKFVDV